MASQIVGVLRAILTADTSEYAKAMQAAGQSTEKIAESIEKSLTPRLSTVSSMIKSMFGASDIRRAEEYAMAVEHYGSVANLVASDQKKVNDALQRALEHYRVLGTEAPDSLKKLEKQFVDLAEAQRKAAEGSTVWEQTQHKLNDETASFTDGIKQMAIGYFTGEAALDAFKEAGRFAIDFLKESITQATDAEKTNRKLTQALTDQGTAIPGVVKLYDDLAKKYQDTTIYSADLIKQQETMLVQVGDVMPSEMDKALNAVTNLAAGLGTDLATATTLVSKGFEDNFTALKKVVPSIDETRAKAEGMTYVLDQINARFKGQAAAEAASYAGQIQQLTNKWHDFQQEIGQLVLSTGALDDFFAVAKWGMSQLVGYFERAKIELFAGLELLRLYAQMRGIIDPDKPKEVVAHEQRQLDAMKNSIDQIVAGVDRLRGKGPTDAVAALKAAQEQLHNLTKAQKDAIDAGIKLNWTTDQIVASAKTSAEVIALYKEQVQKAAEADRKHTADLKEKRAAMSALVDTYLSSDMAKRLPGAVNTGGLFAGPAEQALANILQKRVNLATLPGRVDGIPGVDQGTLAWMNQQYANKALADALGPEDARRKATAAKWTTFGAGAGDVAMRALTGGGNLGQSLASYGATQGLQAATSGLVKNLTTNAITGAAKTGIGAVLGSVIGGAVPLIGGLVGPLLGKLLGPSKGEKANDLRDALKEQLGGDKSGKGLDELVAKYKETASVQSAYHEFLAAKTEDTVQKSADKLRDALNSATSDVEAKSKRMADALGTVSTATAKIAAGFTATLAPALADLGKLQQQLASAQQSGDAEGAAAIAQKIADAKQATATTNQAEFDRLNRITLASFNAYIAQGKSALDAVQAIGPAIDQLKGSADAFGFAGSAAYDQLSRWRTLTTDNAPLLDQVAGLNELMSALGTLGSLDAQTFADLQAQGVDAFKQLTANGFTAQEAETQLAPLLQQVLDLHDKTGMAIDDETQALIDQAREDGALKEKQLSDQQIMVEGFSALIKAIGGEVPAAFEKMTNASKDAAKNVKSDADKAAKGVQDAFDGVDITIPVNYAINGDVTNPDGVPHLARGGIVTRPTLALLGEAGPEAVTPLDRADLGGARTIVLETDGRAWARVHAPYVATEVQRLQLSR